MQPLCVTTEYASNPCKSDPFCNVLNWFFKIFSVYIPVLAGVAISAPTREDAAADLARALREKIVAGQRKFEDVATEESGCNSAKRGG
ncbi:hypothetical protein GUJ93_ZPchr0458g22722 [Zizania palustris]|uniref:Peptidyl-prolyl cis-trans isomerase n=1 Tax=Zizania palustris TaxID=103762 RepID=A0A8J5RC79_ZIZPA|nr:hypothetical protein GUJ93_ZPchr0458g22722 [Zizania palustris]